MQCSAVQCTSLRERCTQPLDSIGLCYAVLHQQISSKEKEISSTEGMTRVKASKYFPTRTANATANLARIEKAISEKDLSTLYDIAITDSNDMHYLAAGVEIVYGNPSTQAVKDWVEDYNKRAGSKLLGYTQDAGPNLVLITTAPHLDQIATAFINRFCTTQPSSFVIDPRRILSPDVVASTKPNPSSAFTVQSLTISQPGPGASAQRIASAAAV